MHNKNEAGNCNYIDSDQWKIRSRSFWSKSVGEPRLQQIWSLQSSANRNNDEFWTILGRALDVNNEDKWTQTCPLRHRRQYILTSWEGLIYSDVRCPILQIIHNPKMHIALDSNLTKDYSWEATAITQIDRSAPKRKIRWRPLSVHNCWNGARKFNVHCYVIMLLGSTCPADHNGHNLVTRNQINWSAWVMVLE